jgi:phage terminase large subunit GpA-like protein
MAIKGVDNSLVPINAPTKVDLNLRGKKLKSSVRLWKIGASMIKSEFYNSLKKSRSDSENQSGAASRCHFPEYNTEYFKQLTAEQLVTRIVKGYPKRIWQKTRDRNEVLDCRVYARAAGIALGVDRWSESKWEQLSGTSQKQINAEVSELKPQIPSQILAKNSNYKRPKIIRSSFI